MARKLQLISFLCVTYFFGYAQDKTAEFKNGNKIQYTVVSNNPDDMHRVTVFGGLSLNESQPRLDLAATYLIPNRIQFGLYVVPISSYGADAFLLFGKKEKERTFTVRLADRQYKRDTTTVYTVGETVKSKRFLAVHAAYEGHDYAYRINQVGVGFAMTKFTHYRIVIHDGDDRSKIKTNQFTLGIDALLYPGKKVGDVLSEPLAEKVVTPVGAKVFYEFRSSLAGTKDLGLYIRLSGEYDLAGKFIPKGALGIFGGY